MSRYMSTKDRILCADINLVKTFIAACTPKNWCYDFIIVLYVHQIKCQTIFIKTVFIIHQYIYTCIYIYIYIYIYYLVLVSCITVILSIKVKNSCSVLKVELISY